MRVSATQILADQPQWRAASQALEKGEIPHLTIPIATSAELPKINQHLQLTLTPEQLATLAKANLNINVHFDTSHQAAQPVISLLSSVLAPPAGPTPIAVPKPLSPSTGIPATPPITILQGAGGGAVIGGIGGAGLGLLLQSLKSTADTLTNPVVGTIATVLLGIAAGAAGGAVYAKTTEYQVKITPGAVTLSAGSQVPGA
jgi:hypothetical protein